MKKHRYAINELYKSASLTSIANHATGLPLGDLGDVDFARFQKELIEGMFDGFKVDFFTASTLRYSSDQSLIDISAVCHNISPRLIDEYQLVSDLDPMAASAYVNPGRVIFAMEDRDIERWNPAEEMMRHISNFSIYRAVLIVFRHPTKRGICLSLDYLAEAANLSWFRMQVPKLELASFPFALAWFYRKGVFDEAQLRYHLEGLAGLTETQLQNLRKFINCYKPYKAQAADLGIKEGSLKESLYDLRDKIVLNRGCDLTDAQGKMRFLENEYSIMRMLGDHTALLMH